MSRSIWLLSCAALCALTLTCAVAGAARAADNDAYIFGTSLVLTSPKSLTTGNTYWSELLPKAYNYSIGSIVDAVNEARAARGIKAEVDVAAYPVVIGSEVQANGAYEYNIDFLQMTPDDVAVALKKFPLGGKLAGLPHTTRPVSIGYFNGDSTDGGATVALTILGQPLQFTSADSFDAIHAAVAKVLAGRFGEGVKFDLSINRFETVVPESQGSFGVYVTVYLNGAEKSAPATGEGGD
jgi:hypothetical protein